MECFASMNRGIPIYRVPQIRLYCTSIEEKDMPRGHCKVGSNIYEVFQMRSHDLVAADAEKRRAVTMASRGEWREIARQAEEARMEFERVRCAYIEHVVSCKTCDWDTLAHSYLNSIAYIGYGATGSSLMLAEIA
jgi:hypothetical protein